MRSHTFAHGSPISPRHPPPLVFTNDFLMASAGAFEGAVLSFASAGDYRAIRGATARGYATARGHALARLGGVFTNPADPRWGHWHLD